MKEGEIRKHVGSRWGDSEPVRLIRLIRPRMNIIGQWRVEDVLTGGWFWAHDYNIGRRLNGMEVLAYAAKEPAGT